MKMMRSTLAIAGTRRADHFPSAATEEPPFALSRLAPVAIPLLYSAMNSPGSTAPTARFIFTKSILIALLLSLVSIAWSSQLGLATVSLPLYLHGSDEDPRISIREVPFATFGADPEWRFPAISTPFMPPTGNGVKTCDVNLTSLYGITVEGNYKDNGMDMVVTINASKAIQPEGYPFTVEQVIDAVSTCVKLMYPPRPADEGKFEIVITRPAKKSAKGK